MFNSDKLNEKNAHMNHAETVPICVFLPSVSTQITTSFAVFKRGTQLSKGLDSVFCSEPYSTSFLCRLEQTMLCIYEITWMCSRNDSLVTFAVKDLHAKKGDLFLIHLQVA